MPNKNQFLAAFENLKLAFEDRVLTDMPILKGQTLMENAKIEKFKWDILGDFRTKNWQKNNVLYLVCHLICLQTKNGEKRDKQKKNWYVVMFVVL